MDNGWIKLHRLFTKWEWYQKSEMVHLFLHFLLMANHSKKDWQGNIIERGQFVTGLHSLRKETGLPISTIRTCIKRLKSTGEITSKSTNRFSIITIVKYDYYQQDDKKSTSRLTYRLTNNQQAESEKSTTNKNNTRIKEDINTSEHSSQGIPVLIDLFKSVNPSYKKFFGNTTQRAACARMIETHGMERLQKIIKFLPQSNSKQYAPVITTPLQLEDKFGQLESFWRKESNNQPLLNL